MGYAKESREDVRSLSLSCSELLRELAQGVPGSNFYSTPPKFHSSPLQNGGKGRLLHIGFW